MPEEVILPIILAIIGSNGIWAVIDGIIQSKRDDRLKKLDEERHLIREQVDTIRLLKEAEIASLQDRLLHLSDKYIENGTLSLNQLHSYNNLYMSYHKLGGNSFITKLSEKVDSLPIREEQ